MLPNRLTVVLCLLIASACGSATNVIPRTAPPTGENDPSWAAIGKTCTPSSPVYTVPQARLDSAPSLTHGQHRTIDDNWADIARETPGGFGGIIVEDGVPVVFLTDTTRKAAAIAALEARHITSHNLDYARVRQGRWNFAQLADWFRYFRLNVMAPPMTLADIDEGRNRITFGTADAAGRRVMEQRLAGLDVPCYLVGFESFSGAIIR